MDGTRRGWTIVATSLLFQAFSYGTIISSFALFMPLWSAEFGIAHSTATLFLTGSVLLSGLVGGVAGRLFDIFPVRLLVIVGAGLYIGAFLLLSVVPNAWGLALIYSVVLSVTFVLLGSLPSQVLVARWFGARASVPLAIVCSGLALGGVLLPPVVALLIEAAHGWRGACRILALVMAAVILPPILLVVRDGGERTAAAPPAHASPATRDSARGVFAEPIFWWTLAAALPLWMMFTAYQTNLGPLAASRGESLTVVSLNLSVLNAAGLLATSTAGWMLIRVPHRAMLQLGAAICAAGIVGFAFTTGPATLLASSALVGLGTGATGSVLASYFCLRFAPARMGRTMGMALLVSRLAIVAPTLFALAAERSGGYALPLAALAALALLSISAATRMPGGGASPETGHGTRSVHEAA